jgi:hypothetical protein
MIVSVHIAEPGPAAALSALRHPPDPATTPGLGYAKTTLLTPIAARRPPRPGRVGMIAAWEQDGAIDEFLGGHPTGERLAAGWHARLEPLRVFGSWAGMPGLPSQPRPHEDGEPVAVLTLGQLRLRRVRPFLRASGRAEADAVSHPALLASTALARPPHLVSTFSLWRSAAEMRDYATRSDGGHSAAVRTDRERNFHRESAFIRFRPYASSGSWDGHDPLAP